MAILFRDRPGCDIWGFWFFEVKKDLAPEKQELLEPHYRTDSQALRMYYLVISQQESKVSAETEKIKNSLLRSISHDLRTPLTAIMGSSTACLKRGKI